MCDLNVWPFYEIDGRLGCMKEYNGLQWPDEFDSKDKNLNPFIKKIRNNMSENIHLAFSKVVIQFQKFICPMVYSSRDERKITRYALTKTSEDQAD